MTMAASIEARMPFIDYELAAFLSSLPDSFRIRSKAGSVTQKWILREAMRDVLPPAILSRQEANFRVPTGLWFRTTLKGYVYETLLKTSSHTRAFYRREALKA